jgi:hypothetical protein
MSFAIYFMYDLYSYVVATRTRFHRAGGAQFLSPTCTLLHTHPSPSRQPVERIKAMQLARYDSCEKCGLMECHHEDI